MRTFARGILPTSTDGDWLEFTDEGNTRVEISGYTLSLILKDGERGDMGAANHEIIEFLGAPAIPDPSDGTDMEQSSGAPGFRCSLTYRQPPALPDKKTAAFRQPFLYFCFKN